MSRCDLQKTESARADNRSAFPATALIMDEFRAAFGADVRLVYAEENGIAIGRKPTEPGRFVTADGWLRSSVLVKEELERRKSKQPQKEGRR